MSVGNLNLLVSSDIKKQLAADVKRLRLVVHGWKRDTLAQRSGVPSSTIKRFESTGEISLRQFLMLVQALGMLSRFDHLLETDVEGMRMDDLLQQVDRNERKRGSM